MSFLVAAGFSLRDIYINSLMHRYQEMPMLFCLVSGIPPPHFAGDLETIPEASKVRVPRNNSDQAKA